MGQVNIDPVQEAGVNRMVRRYCQRPPLLSCECIIEFLLSFQLMQSAAAAKLWVTYLQSQSFCMGCNYLAGPTFDIEYVGGKSGNIQRLQPKMMMIR